MATTSLEIKKVKVELSRVRAAKDDMDYQIEMRLSDIERLKEQMAIQEAKEVELAAKIADLSK